MNRAPTYATRYSGAPYDGARTTRVFPTHNHNACGFVVDPYAEGFACNRWSFRHSSNPFRDEDGAPVSPESYGFALQTTGGGCEAWSRTDDFDDVLITCQDGTTAPRDDLDGFLMCGYDPGDGCRVTKWKIEGEPHSPAYSLPRVPWSDSNEWRALLGRLQSSIGLTDDGHASVFFSGVGFDAWWLAADVATRAELIAEYVRYERQWMDADV